MPDRIQANCHTGKGNLGTSNLLSGWTVRKSSQVCALQNSIELLKNLLSKYVLLYSQPKRPRWFYRFLNFCRSVVGLPLEPLVTIDKEDLALLTHYRDHLNDFAALVYFRFDSPKYQDAFTKFDCLCLRHKDLCDELVSAKDFIVYTDKRSIALDRIRIQIRTVEHLMWVVIDSLYGEFTNEYQQGYGAIIEKTATEINFLSNYAFNLNRYEMLKQHRKETYWNPPPQ